MGLQAKRGIILSFRKSQYFIREAARRLELGAELVEEPQPPSDGEKLGGLPYLLTKLSRTVKSVLYLLGPITLDQDQRRAERNV